MSTDNLDTTSSLAAAADTGFAVSATMAAAEAGVPLQNITPERTVILWRITAKLWRGSHTINDLEHANSRRVKRQVLIVPDQFTDRIRGFELRIDLLRQRYTYPWEGVARVGSVDSFAAIAQEIEAIRAEVRPLMDELLGIGIDSILEDARQMWIRELRSEEAAAAVLAKYPRSTAELLEKFGGVEACGVAYSVRKIDGVPEVLAEHGNSAFAREAVDRSRREIEAQLEQLVSGAREALVDVLQRTSRQVATGDRISDATFTDLHNGLLLLRNFGAQGTNRTREEVDRVVLDVERIMGAARSARDGGENITERTRAAAEGFTLAAEGLRRVLEDRTELEAARTQIGLARQRQLAF